MRHALAVQARSAGPARWRRIELALWALASGVVGGWLLAWLGFPPIAMLAVGTVAALWLMLDGWRAARAERLTLRWDGSRWSAAADGAVAVDVEHVRVAIDGGGWLLLRLAGAALPARWRWWLLTARDAGPAFRDLCTALYAQPSGAVVPERR